MAFRKRTLRKLPATTKRVAIIIAELESAARRLRNLIPEIEDMEKEKKINELVDKRYGLSKKEPF